MSSRAQVALACVAPHIREWPGLKRMVYESSGEVAFCGQRSVLEESDLVPLGTPFPGEVPGARGIRWKDESGRRHVLSRWGSKTSNIFRLIVYPTAAEKKRLEEQLRVGTQLAKVDREIKSLDVPEEQYRAHLARFMCAAGAAARGIMFSEEDSWSYGPDAQEEFEGLLAQMQELITSSPVVRNQSALENARRKRAALTDEKFRNTMLKVVAGSAT
ncbi:hypothetical protein [Hydrogenophaga sp. ANAO-22]|uniref:hypothetical protein n=1 Tax=Hydrogenophaga sp. ANAO-22 TaxID=3166645 RepID=UPI0036D240E3